VGPLRSIRAGLVQQARIVLLAADGIGTNEIVRRTGVSKPTMIAWKRRYVAEGIGGLEDRPKPGKPRTTDGPVIRRLCTNPQAPAYQHRLHVLLKHRSTCTGFMSCANS
jgi:transposase